MSVGASGDGNALESSLKQSSKIQESLKSKGLDVKVSASADTAVSQKKTTTKEQAKSNGISYNQLSGSQSASPPSPSSSPSSPPAKSSAATATISICSGVIAMFLTCA
jgi:hypothetical protein